MKKILIALAVMAGITLTGTAFAQDNAPARLRWEPVRFRSMVAANPSSVWDSLALSRVGAAGANAVLCTTTAISTVGWVPVPNQALSDTSGFTFLFQVYDQTGSDACESGADSMAACLQGSPDGETWVSFNTFKTGTKAQTTTSRNDQTIVSGIFNARISENGAALAAGAPIWHFKFKKRAVSAWDQLEIGDPIQFPFIRFVLLLPDAKGYKVNAKIGYFSTSTN